MTTYYNTRDSLIVGASKRLDIVNCSINPGVANSIVIPWSNNTIFPQTLALTANVIGYVTPKYRWGYKLGNSGTITYIELDNNNNPTYTTTKTISHSLPSSTILSGSDHFITYYLDVIETGAGTLENKTSAELSIPIIRDGSKAYNNKVITIYTRNNTGQEPTLDNLTEKITWSFNANSLAGTLPTGWGLAVPTNTTGAFLWESHISVYSVEPTVEFTNNQFSTPVLLMSDGATPINMVLSNESANIPANSAGEIISSGLDAAKTNVYVYEGSNLLKYVNTTTAQLNAGEYNISASGEYITPGSPAGDGTTTVSYGSPASMTQASATITFTINGKSSLGKAFTITKKQTLAKLNNGSSPLYYALEPTAFTLSKQSNGQNIDGVYSTTTIYAVEYNGNITTTLGSGYTIKYYYDADTDAKASVSASTSGVTIAPANNAACAIIRVELVKGNVVLDTLNIPVIFKGDKGNVGDNAAYVDLLVDKQVIAFDSAGNTPGTAKVTFTATAYNIASPNYRFLVDGVEKQKSTATTYEYDISGLTYSNLPKQIKVEVYSTSTGTTVLASDTISLAGVKPGADAITVTLSNENQTVTAAYDGTVSSLDSVITDIRVYDGANELTYDGTGTAKGKYKVTASGFGITAGSVALVANTIYARSAKPNTMTSESATITFTITGVTNTGVTFTVTKDQTISKAKAGKVGDNAAYVDLVVDKQVASFDSAGNTPSTTSFVFTATANNITDPYYQFLVNGTEQRAKGTSNTYTFTKADLIYSDLPKQITVKVYSGSSGTTVLASDTMSIAGVKPGANGKNAITAVLSNENHTLPASYLGAVSSYTGADTDIRIYDGATELTYEIYNDTTNLTAGTTSGKYTIKVLSNDSSNITVPDITLKNSLYANCAPTTGISDTVDIAYIKYTITGKSIAGESFTVTKTQTFSKSRAGSPGDPGGTGARGSIQVYKAGAEYTNQVTVDDYKLKATTAIADKATNPATPIQGDMVTFSNGTDFVYTLTYDVTDGWKPPGTVIDGSLLVTGSVTAAKINATGLTIRKSDGTVILDAGGGTPVKWVDVGGDNKPIDPFFEDSSAWVKIGGPGTFELVTPTAGTSVTGGKVLRATGHCEIQSTAYIPVNLAKIYISKCRARSNTTGAINCFYAGFACYDKDKNYIAPSPAGSSYNYSAFVGTVLPTTWTPGQGIIDQPVAADAEPFHFRTNTAYVRLLLLCNFPKDASQNANSEITEVDSLEFYDYTEVYSSSKVKLIPTANVIVDNNTVTKTSSGGAWDAGAYSSVGYVGGMYCSAIFQQNTLAMISLNTDPATDSNYTSLDYAIYCQGTNLQIYESAMLISTHEIGGSVAGKVCAITYDGTKIRYLVDGTVLREVAANITSKLYFDCSIYTLGTSITNIDYGPMTSNSWSSIGGDGKPENYANKTYVSNGAIYGVSESSGTMVANSYSTVGGVNLLPNTEFNNTISPWALGENNPGNATVEYVELASKIFGVGGDWTLAGALCDSLVTRQVGYGSNEVAYDIYALSHTWANNSIPVVAGHRYEFSYYAAAHRCYVGGGIQFFDISGNYISGVAIDMTQVGSGGRWLSGYSRIGVFATVPATAAVARVYVRKYNTLSSNDSYMWVARPYFGECNANQTVFSPYSTGMLTDTKELADGAGLGTTAVWSSVTGTGKPENDATKGATFGLNVYGKMLDPAVYIPEVSISGALIKYAEITDAHITSLNADKITAGTIQAGRIDVTKLSGATATFNYTGGVQYFTTPDASYSYTTLAITIIGGAGGGGAGGIVGGDYSALLDPYYYGLYKGGSGFKGTTNKVIVSNVPPNTTIAITVGGGGAGGTTTARIDTISNVVRMPSAGSAGGTSSVTISGITYSAGGGAGGYAPNAHGTDPDRIYVSPPYATYAYNGGGDGGLPVLMQPPANCYGNAGSSGANGLVFIEYFNPNGVLTRSEWSTLMTHLGNKFGGTWP